MTILCLLWAVAQQDTKPLADAAHMETAEGSIDAMNGDLSSAGAAANSSTPHSATTSCGAANQQTVPQSIGPSTNGAAEGGDAPQADNGRQQNGVQSQSSGRPASKGPRVPRTLVLEPLADKVRCCVIWNLPHFHHSEHIFITTRDGNVVLCSSAGSIVAPEWACI